MEFGTGYSNEEYILISNCTSIGNKKYGFFFEHQGRFNNNYRATYSNGFVVSNCIASDNRYDFGGAKAYDVTYENCISQSSINSSTNVLSFYFELQSIRIHMANCISEQGFKDVTNSSEYYYEPANWALNNAISNGIGKKTFNASDICTRGEAVTLLHRLKEVTGDVILYDQDQQYKANEYSYTPYTDVSYNSSYAGAVKWASDESIIYSSDKIFNPDDECTRAQFITMLWKLAGKPSTTASHPYTDISEGSWYEDAVNWAYGIGLIKRNGK